MWRAKVGQARVERGMRRLGRDGGRSLKLFEELLWGNQEAETLARGLEGGEP